MRVHLFIATNQGPVAVQGITREDDDVPAVVCIDGGSTRANISNRYYDFVKKGTGLIARDFGHDAWRLDISDNIEQGDSWQLAVYLAHQIEMSGRLGNGQIEAGDLAVWATGAVRVNNSVHAVDAIAEKLMRSKSFIEAWRDAGATVLMLLPSSNAADVPDSWTLNTDFPSLQELDSLSDLATIKHWPRQDGSTLPSSFRLSRLAVFGAALAAVLAVGVFTIPSQTSGGPEPPLRADIPGSEPPLLAPRLIARSQPCDATEHDRNERSLDPQGEDSFDHIELIGLCSLHFVSPVAKSVIGVGLDRTALIPLAGEPPSWQIPVPDERWFDRRYALIEMPYEITEAQLRALQKHLATVDQGSLLKAGKLEELLGFLDRPWRVYRHTLIADVRGGN